MPTVTPQFINYLNQRWGNSIHLPNLWLVTMYADTTNIGPLNNDTAQSLVLGVNNVLDKYERGSYRGGISPSFPVRGDFFNITGNVKEVYTNGISFLAQSVQLPTDTFKVSNSNNDNMGGFRGGYIGADRESYDSVTIDFLETNIDIVDYFIRPWCLAVSYKGLIEDGDAETNVKAFMDLKLFSPATPAPTNPSELPTPREWEVRKHYSFTGVVPITVPGKELSYGSDIKVISPKVSFAFKDYWIVGGPEFKSI